MAQQQHNNNKMKSNSSLKRASLPASLEATSLQRTGDSTSPADYVPPVRRPRTSEDFYLFCQLILEHENYESVQKADATAIKAEIPVENKKDVLKVEDMDIEDMSVKHETVIEQKPLLTAKPEVKPEEMNGNVRSVENAVSNLQIVASPLSSPAKPGEGPTATTTITNSKKRSKSKGTKATKIVTTTTNSTSANKNGYAASADESDDSDHDVEAYDLITCYCQKPFAGRPMIECSRCMTWLHMNCAKVRRNNIPEIFYCFKCQDDMRGGDKDKDSSEKTSSSSSTSANTNLETSTASTTTTLNGRKKNGENHRTKASPLQSQTPKSGDDAAAAAVSASTSTQPEQKPTTNHSTKVRKVKNNHNSNQPQQQQQQSSATANSQVARNNNNSINKGLTLNGSKTTPLNTSGTNNYS